MDNRLVDTLAAYKKRGRKILVCYFSLCDPAMGDGIELAREMFCAGVDVLEIGLPYEDPSLDGPVVRASMARALAGHTVDDAFGEIARLRAACPDGCLQVMTYHEVVERMGVDTFSRRVAEAGADAVLSPNVPSDRQDALDAALAARGLVCLRFSPFHQTPESIADVLAHGQGYVFQQAVDGATGAQDEVSPHVGEAVAALRRSGVTVPVCAGFGVSAPWQAARLVEMGADGVIVGSSVVTAALEGRLAQYVSQLRAALDGAGSALDDQHQQPLLADSGDPAQG